MKTGGACTRFASGPELGLCIASHAMPVISGPNRPRKDLLEEESRESEREEVERERESANLARRPPPERKSKRA